MLERMREDMPAVYKRVVARLHELEKADTVPPPEESAPPPPAKEPGLPKSPQAKPEGRPELPDGRPGQFLLFFQGLTRALKNGGVWAAVTLLLMVCAYQANELKASNDRIVEILLAVKIGNEAPEIVPMIPAARPVPTGIAAAASPVSAPKFNPKEVLSRYHNMYQQQVEQRTLAELIRRPRPAAKK